MTRTSVGPVRGLQSGLRQHPELAVATRRAVRLFRLLAETRRLASDTSAYVATSALRPTDDPSVGPPVFVVGASWRSGTTAVQRLIVGSGAACIWGEPFTEAQIIPRLRRIEHDIAIYQNRREHLLGKYMLSESMLTEWPARTYPEFADVREACRAYLKSLYQPSATDLGFRRWGVKETCLRGSDIEFLLRTYPDAKFVFLIRDPRKAYRSFRGYVSGVPKGSKYGGRTPRWVMGPAGFASTWKTAAICFRRHQADSNILLRRYEDIAGNEAFVRDLSEFLDADLDASIWEARVRKRPSNDGRDSTATASLVSKGELAVVSRLTANEARKWHYGI